MENQWRCFVKRVYHDLSTCIYELPGKLLKTKLNLKKVLNPIKNKALVH
jgi:hypothetical protein